MNYQPKFPPIALAVSFLLVVGSVAQSPAFGAFSAEGPYVQDTTTAAAPSAPKSENPKPTEPKPETPKPADPKPAEPKPAEPKATEPAGKEAQPPSPVAETKLLVFPENIELSTVRDRQTIVAQLLLPNGITEDVSDRIQIKIAHPELIQYQGRILTPLADGETTVTVSVDKYSIELPAKVVAAGKKTRCQFQK